MIVGLFVGVWVARYLGPSQFGTFSFAQSFVFLFVALSTLGLDGVVIRELVKDESRKNIILGTAFGLKLVGTILVFLLLLMILPFTNNDYKTSLLVYIIATSMIFQCFNVIDMYFQSKVLSKYISWANAIVLAISSIIKVTLILLDAPLIFFAFVVAFDGLVLAVGLLFFYTKVGEKVSEWRFHFGLAKELLNDSWPLILANLFYTIYAKIDQVMINEMLGPEAVGNYAAAMRLSDVWYFLPIAVTSSVFPAILNAKKSNYKLYEERMQKLYLFMVWMALAIALPMTFISDALVLALYGVAYEGAGLILMIHIWASVFVFLGVASSKWLLAENLPFCSLYRNLFGLVLNVSLNYFFIPIMGAVGAAIASLIAYAAAFYLFDLFFSVTRGAFYMKTRAFFPLYLIK